MASLITKRDDSESEWIEEEERLIHWAETPNFEKTPLDHIGLTFVYTAKKCNNDDDDNDNDKTVVGIIKTIVELENKNTFSVLHRTAFFDKINVAKTPFCFQNDVNAEWSKNAYEFEESMIYHIAVESDSSNMFDPKVLFVPLYFSNDVAKITNSRVDLKDLYEIIIIMREVSSPAISNGLKSILKSCSKPGKTKKVRIDERVYSVSSTANIKKTNKNRKTRKHNKASFPN